MSQEQRTRFPRFRLVFTDPHNTIVERTQQIHSPNFEGETEQLWMKKLFTQAGPDAYVAVYETTEQVIKYIRKPKPEKQE